MKTSLLIFLQFHLRFLLFYNCRQSYVISQCDCAESVYYESSVKMTQHMIVICELGLHHASHVITGSVYGIEYNFMLPNCNILHHFAYSSDVPPLTLIIELLFQLSLADILRSCYNVQVFQLVNNVNGVYLYEVLILSLCHNFITIYNITLL